MLFIKKTQIIERTGLGTFDSCNFSTCFQACTTCNQQIFQLKLPSPTCTASNNLTRASCASCCSPEIDEMPHSWRVTRVWKGCTWLADFLDTYPADFRIMWNPSTNGGFSIATNFAGRRWTTSFFLLISSWMAIAKSETCGRFSASKSSAFKSPFKYKRTEAKQASTLAKTQRKPRGRSQQHSLNKIA